MSEAYVNNRLSVSRMQSYARCQRLHYYQYIAGYKEARKSKALLFGELFHEFQEQWWTTGTWLPPRVDVLPSKDYKVLQALCHGYNRTWRDETFGCPGQPPMTIHGVEVEFDAPIFSPDLKRRTRKMRLNGKIDVIASLSGASDHPTPFVVEHKSTSSTIESDGEDYWQKLFMDPQLSMYMIGAATLGYQCEEAMYDVVRKPSIRQGKNETEDVYIERFKEDVAANPRSYFRRRFIPRMSTEVSNFVSDAWTLAKTLQRKNGLLPVRNPDQCYAFGSKCAFLNVCLGLETLDECSDIVKRGQAPEKEGGISGDQA